MTETAGLAGSPLWFQRTRQTIAAVHKLVRAPLIGGANGGLSEIALIE
jgi:hypothetical protein